MKHDWFTEYDSSGLPLYRVCYRCGRFEQPVNAQFLFHWVKIDTESISFQVLKERQRIINQNKAI